MIGALLLFIANHKMHINTYKMTHIYYYRVSKLCDFNPKTSKNVADVSRMRSIILQLKQGPAANNVSA